jgi:hypothetical protein
MGSSKRYTNHGDKTTDAGARHDSTYIIDFDSSQSYLHGRPKCIYATRDAQNIILLTINILQYYWARDATLRANVLYGTFTIGNATIVVPRTVSRAGAMFGFS